MTNDASENFDRSPDGQVVIALLRRHAPPLPDTEAAVRRVSTRLNQGSSARLLWLKVAGPIAALAAGIMIALFIMAPPVTPGPTPDAVKDLGPSPAASAAARPMRFFTVRSASEGRVVLDSGLAAGLRSGDLLEGAGGVKVKVSAPGIFVAQAIIEAGLPKTGQRLGCEATKTMLESQLSQTQGGDPLALYDFGAVFRNLSPQDARQRGFASGRALAVREVMGSLLRSALDKNTTPTLAGRLGLKTDDVVLSVNGVAVSDVAALTRALEAARRGGLTMRVLRGEREVALVTE